MNMNNMLVTMLFATGVCMQASGADPSADTQLAQPTQPTLLAPTSRAVDAGTNAAAVPPEPTASAASTNVVSPSSTATNGSTAVNTTPEWLQRDQAITPEDQGMLTQMRQAVFPPGQPMASWMGSVHFILKDGAVRLVGTVPSTQERQRIEDTVRQVPGIVRIYDALAVDPAADVAAAGAAGQNNSAISSTTPGPVLSPTSHPATNQNATGPAPANPAATNSVYENPPTAAPR